MAERTQLNINIKPDLLKNLKKVALENNRKLVELINEVLSNYICLLYTSDAADE